MTEVAIRTSTRPNVLALAAAVLLSIFAISLVIADPGPRDASEIQFGPYP